MTTPTALDALKYVCLTGIDHLDYITENLIINDDLDEDDHRVQMLHALSDSMHKALQSQVPYMLTPARYPGGAEAPHSNTYEQARHYSDGSPVYVDRREPAIGQDPDGEAYPTTHWHRDFFTLPAGDPA